MNAISLDAAANRGDTITSADTIVVDGIAHQLALQGGEAVYWSRGRLRLDNEDEYVSALRKAHPVQAKTPLDGNKEKREREMELTTQTLSQTIKSFI